MAKQAVALRLDPAVLERVDEYAASRGVARQTVLEEAVARALNTDSASPASVNTFVGVGECPERDGGLGHVWGSAKADPERPCVFCGTAGRCNPLDRPREGNFAVATSSRAEVFATLRTPESVKAYGKAKA